MAVKMWSALSVDVGGIVLFLVWLVLPPLYVIALGRRYVRQCVESAAAAVWAQQEVLAVLEGPSSVGRHRLEGT
ncbi:hypothetical protein ABZ816_33410 [Actinosynnema sp. NPDC047251]|nr:hypothetical protein [Saccharothrix espanaensis]